MVFSAFCTHAYCYHEFCLHYIIWGPPNRIFVYVFTDIVAFRIKSTYYKSVNNPKGTNTKNYLREFETPRISLYKLRELKSREFKLSKNEYDANLQV